MFLTEDEIRELTGYSYCSRQIEWLRNNNWKFEITAQKRPKVARSYFEFRLGAAFSSRVGEPHVEVRRPNFNAISRLVRG
ncbi:DUF4224 domain-containing protein [Undibacterium danionis]|uniref:DUF4224 domain-containing protein n=1 Tax=Undibacterium danionis TaxID=1812100 RepID=A0ABV6IC25_9BURK